MLANQKMIEKGAGVVVIAALVLGCLLVLWPFISALLWAAILCLATWPAYEMLTRKLRGRCGLAALLMTLALLLLLFVPFVLVGASFADNIRDAIRWMNLNGDTLFDAPPDWLVRIPFIGPGISDRWAEVDANSEQVWNALRPWVNNAARWILQHTLSFAQGLLMMGLGLLVTFFFYRDGRAAVEHIRNGFGRVIGETGQRLLDVAARTVRSVVYGVIGTGLAQAVVAWIGFLIAGVPGASLLAILTFFLSIIPVGPPIAWGGAAIWLLAEGRIGWGIFMLVYGTLCVSGIDNLVKPYLISKGSKLSFILMLLGVLGGMTAFGFIGVFIGPTLLAVGHSLIVEMRWSRQPPASGT